jgi:hypothetical protein
MKTRWIFALIVVLAAALAVIYACGDDDDDDNDDNDDNDDQAPCTISGEGLAEVPGGGVAVGCGPIGLAIAVDTILADSEFTRFEVQGNFAIDNENTYYLRGPGFTADQPCFETIKGYGSYEVRAEFSECTDDFAIDVITVVDEVAFPFCTIEINLSSSCPDDDDDTLDDDDYGYECEEGQDAFAFLLFDCGLVFTDQNGYEITYQDLLDICDQCLIACYDNYENCDDMVTCIEQACL